MAVVKKNFRVSRLEGGEVLGSPNTMSSDEEPVSESDEVYDDEDDEDFDSGMESDDGDASEVGEVGEELCQVGKEVCGVPIELYDLPDLSEVLSVDVWNDLLTEEERFGLTEFLPDMDEMTYMRTLKELFTGGNFHFGSPAMKLFDMMRGGLCEPRVALYRQGFNFFENRRHYHLLQKYQDYAVVNLLQIKDAWANCRGYSIQEKLRVLKLTRSQKSLMNEKVEDVGLGSDSSGREGLGEEFWRKRSKETVRVDASARGRAMIQEPVKYEKPNQKKMLKIAGPNASYEKDLMGSFPSSHYGVEMKARQDASNFPLQKSAAGYDSGTTARGSVTKIGLVKAGKNHFVGVPSFSNDAVSSQSKGWNVNQMAAMKEKHDRGSLDRYSRDVGKEAKFPDKVHYYASEDKTKGRGQHMADWSSGNHRFQHNKTKEEPMDYPGNFEDWDMKTKKGKVRPGISKNNLRYDPHVKPYGNFISEMSDALFPSSDRSRFAQNKINREVVQNGVDMEELRTRSRFIHNDETESDSSEQLDSEEDANALRNQWGYPGSVLEGRPVFATDSKQRLLLQNPEAYSMKRKMHDPHYLHNFASGISEESHNLAHNGRIQGDPGERMHGPSLKGHLSEKKQKGKADHGYPLSKFAHHYIRDGDDFVQASLGKRGQTYEAQVTDRHERLGVPLLGCTSVTKKRKKTDITFVDGPDDYDNLRSSPQQQFDDSSSWKKRGKRIFEAEDGPFPTMVDLDPEVKPAKKQYTLITPTVHTGFSFSIIHLLSAVRVAMITARAEDVTAVDKNLEKSDETQKLELQNGNLETVNGEMLNHSQGNMGTIMSESSGDKSLPSLTIQQIVDRVRSNPGDPCILQTQEPLQDLVRGVLKIFSSKTAPLGAKGWKALVFYEKPTKGWLWIGPVSSSTSDDVIEEVTSPESWGLPPKMILKLVDTFANWLKNSQETLQQIGSLPAPPLSLMQPNLDEKERFRDLRAQKSLNTISPSSEEVRAYFRREEVLRYLVPDRAFSYTAADGRKSIVAPLRRCGGKPTSKARDHPILKPDRPPHVTILCLVRDAAARLPGSTGTRADVCTLIRDSQYIVEDVSDAQVNQVVSGALDRLHYERDPCVQFDGERKLWVYLHRDREEEDFEDDGTSSTKKWKRPRKDAADQSEQGIVGAAYHGSGEQIASGSDAAYELFKPDLNIEPSSMQAGDRMEYMYDDLRLNGEQNTVPFGGSGSGNLHSSHPTHWEDLGLNSPLENKMLCQENSNNEIYDEETFSRDRPIGLLSASIS